MICSDCIIGGDSKIYDGAVIHTKVAITADSGNESIVGAQTIIEETSKVHNSSIGSQSLLEVGVVATSSTIGSSTFVGPKCIINNSTIGNGCWICPAIVLTDAHIPDNICVYRVNGVEGWLCRPVDNTVMVQSVEAYREKLLVAESLQALSKNFTKHQYVPLTA